MVATASVQVIRRCLARDYERLSTTLVGLYFVAFAYLMLQLSCCSTGFT